MGYFSIAKVILRGLFQKESTVAYPAAPIARADAVRGHVVLDTASCVFCGICARKCPSGAIAVDRKGKTWTIARFGCILCGECVEVCPKKCLAMRPELTPAGGKTQNVHGVSADEIVGGGDYNVRVD